MEVPCGRLRLNRKPHGVRSNGIDGDMKPVPKSGDQNMLTRIQPFERVLCLGASQMHDSGSGGNRLPGGRNRHIQEQVVVAGIGLLDTGGNDLHSMSLQYDSHVWSGDRGTVCRPDDLDAARLRSTATPEDEEPGRYA